jgi:hypothetical protein
MLEGQGGSASDQMAKGKGQRERRQQDALKARANLSWLEQGSKGKDSSMASRGVGVRHG